MTAPLLLDVAHFGVVDDTSGIRASNEVWFPCTLDAQVQETLAAGLVERQLGLLLHQWNFGYLGKNSSPWGHSMQWPYQTKLLPCILLNFTSSS